MTFNGHDDCDDLQILSSIFKIENNARHDMTWFEFVKVYVDQFLVRAHADDMVGHEPPRVRL